MLYDLALLAGKITYCLMSLFNKKSALWCRGQKGLVKRIENDMRLVDGRVVWFHCASLGEFEQGRQLIEEWREKYPSDTIIITFFSPSGYEIRKDYKGADYIYYLPLDTTSNARRFIKAINPKYAIFIKYEYWNNYTKELKKIGAKVYVVSAIFRKNSMFFHPCGGAYRAILRRFDHLFLQNEASKELLSSIGITNTTVCGDTRFDRVLKIASQTKPIPKVEAFVSNNSDVFITGSSWPKDDEITIELVASFPDIKFIIVPHEIEETKIEDIVEHCAKLGRKTVRYSKENDTDSFCEAEVLVIDVIGILSSTYGYCKYAYIGGGFGAGIHNTLEAATFGLPIMFGPKHERFDEAVALVNNGIATVIKTPEEAKEWLLVMSSNKERYLKISSAAKTFVVKNGGASQEILNSIH